MPAPPGRPAGLACRHPQQPPAGRRTPPADRPRRGGRPGGAGHPALGRSPDRPGHLELPAGAAGRVGSRRPGRGAAVHGAAATAVRAVAADPVTRPVGPAATEPSRLRPGSWSRALAARRRSGHAAGKVSLGHLPGAAAGLVRSAARAAVGGRRRHAVGSASAPHRGRRSPDPLPVGGGPARPAPTAVAALRLPHHRGAPARPAPRGSPILPAHHSAGRRRAAARDRPGQPGPTPVQAPAGPAPQPKARARRSGPERRPLHDEPATRSTGPGRSSSGTAAPPTAAASGGCARARDGARRSRFRRPSPSGSAKPQSCRATPQQHRHRTLDTPDGTRAGNHRGPR